MDTQLLEKILRVEEGNWPRLYDDANDKLIVPGYTVVGNPTVGVGRNLLTNPLSQQAIDLLLGEDIDGKETALNQLDWYVALDPIRQVAIADMAFNMGVKGVLSFPAMITALRSKSWKVAHDECLNSEYGRKLPHRAGNIAAILLTGMVF